MNIGISFVSRETTPVGRALSFNASHRVRCQKGGKVTEADKMFTGDGNSNIYSTVKQKVKLELHKSKLTVPHREVWLVFDLEEGAVDDGTYILARALQEGLVTNTKGWWKVKGKKKKYRADALIDHIYENDELYSFIVGELFPWASTE
jgi:RecA/RadA recombinase